MPIYKLKLLERKEVAKETHVFTFEKPLGFHFIPGQYGGFTINDAEGKPITRRFSLLNPPDDTVIAIATRMQDTPFKRALKELPLGTEVKFAGPTGNFVLDNNINQPMVMIAGGIGITPFYSMLKHAIKESPSREFYLFYGNQTQLDSAFLDEIFTWQTKLFQFKFIPTLAQPDQTWKGEAGFITHTMLKKYIPDLKQPVYYVCGSPAMVNALREILIELEIDEEKIYIEDFPGY